jgi:predicted O-methyltransferase YrrM
MNKLWLNLFNKAARKVLKMRKEIRHYEPSFIFSPTETVANEFLVNLFSQAIQKSWRDEIDLPEHATHDSIYLNICPGEHYRLLKAIAAILNAKLAVEIGTYTGLGAIALMQGLLNGRVVTYDLVPWNTLPTILSQEYFDSHLISQCITDLSDINHFNQNLAILNEADIIFVDGPKDGVFEYKFIPLLSRLSPKKDKILVIDDIRFVNMIDLWVNIRSPKLDVTSFGHWSGTGIVDISQPLQMKTII